MLDALIAASTRGELCKLQSALQDMETWDTSFFVASIEKEKCRRRVEGIEKNKDIIDNFLINADKGRVQPQMLSDDQLEYTYNLFKNTDVIGASIKEEARWRLEEEIMKNEIFLLMVASEGEAPPCMLCFWRVPVIGW